MNKLIANYATSEECKVLCSKEHVTKLPTIRSMFERDRDRILHSKAFKRLAHKSQVFIYDGGDHHRNRLTHTLEVESIALSISSTLRLNSFLCSSIALSHDLGATPFGKNGEIALYELTKRNSLNGFKHNHQGIRVVENLEQQYPNYQGLNLTLAVKEGILKHKDVDENTLSLHSEHLTSFVKNTNLNISSTLEGQAVRIADNIAQIYHYIEDGFRYNLVPITVVLESSLWKTAAIFIKKRFGLEFDNFISKATDDIKKLTICRFLIKFIITSLIENTKKIIADIGENNIHPGKITNLIVNFNDSTHELIDDFYKQIIDPFILQHNSMVIMSIKSMKTIYCIFESFQKCPAQLPIATFRRYQEAKRNEGNIELRIIVDHISGMTDRYAVKTYKILHDIEYNPFYF